MAIARQADDAIKREEPPVDRPGHHFGALIAAEREVAVLQFDAVFRPCAIHIIQVLPRQGFHPP